MLNIWKRRHNNIHSTKEPTQDATKTLLERLRLKTILSAPIETFVLLPSFVAILKSYFWSNKSYQKKTNVKDLLRSMMRGVAIARQDLAPAACRCLLCGNLRNCRKTINLKHTQKTIVDNLMKSITRWRMIVGQRRDRIERDRKLRWIITGIIEQGQTKRDQ